MDVVVVFFLPFPGKFCKLHGCFGPVSMSWFPTSRWSLGSRSSWLSSHGDLGIHDDLETPLWMVNPATVDW
jgi:hypothetical protein